MTLRKAVFIYTLRGENKLKVRAMCVIVIKTMTSSLQVQITSPSPISQVKYVTRQVIREARVWCPVNMLILCFLFLFCFAIAEGREVVISISVFNGFRQWCQMTTEL